MTWRKPPVDTEAVKRLADRYDIDLLTAAILVRRGVVESSRLAYYLETGIQYLHSPFLFDDMADVVERIFQARDEGEIVLVYGDRDVDGITSTTVMVQTLRELGIDVRWRVPAGDEAYGLTRDAVESFAAENGTLIITVDCGITNNDEIALAAKAGIDTIVIDHHNATDSLPPAVAVVNPKVGDSYPFQGLCACTVAAKVRQAIAFGQTELFGERTTLLNLRPLNDTVVIDAIQVENNLEVDRISEALVPGVGTLETSRLSRFLMGRRLVCYDEPLQQRIFRTLLGDRADVFLLDIKPEVERAFPRFAGKSLLQMRELSRMPRYRSDTAEEIDVLLALYQSVAEVRFPSIRTAIESVSDLCAVATLADMMPILDENRILVRTGLRRINENPHSGFATLLRRINLIGKRVASRDISWGVNPVLNASGRMGLPEKAVELFLGETETARDELAREVVELNKKRRRVGDDAWKAVLPEARRQAEVDDAPLLVVFRENIHRGVTGLLAGRLVRMFRRPAIVLTTVETHIVGSVRSARGFVATDFLARFDGVLSKWGGHDQAAGFSLPLDGYDEFASRLDALLPSISLDDSADEEVVIDAELPPRYLTPDLESVVQAFEPYGQANPELRFLSRNLFLERVDFIGKDQEHLRLLLSGGGYKWPAVYWNASEAVDRDFRPQDRVDAVFEFTKNYYNGNETVQLVIVDLVRSEGQVAQ